MWPNCKIPEFKASSKTKQHTQFYQVGEQGIRLFVLEDDVDLAQEIIYQMDTNMLAEPEESFHDADLEDIEYQKQLNSSKSNNKLLLFAIIITVLLLAYAYYLGTNSQSMR